MNLNRELFSDGGCVGKNGQAQAGTWAWCHATDGVMDASGSGFVMVEDVAPFESVTNNTTELLALVLGLESLPAGWSGYVYSDSKIALLRVFRHGAMNGVPSWLAERARGVLSPLGDVRYILLGGHPEKCSEEERAAGFRSDGKPIHALNQWCDEECNRRKSEAIEAMAAKRPPVLPPVTQADMKGLKGVEVPENIRKKDPDLFDLLRSDLAKMLVREEPLAFEGLDDAEVWAKAHRIARKQFGRVLDVVASRGAHITKAYPHYLRELLLAIPKDDAERIDAKHGISAEIAACDNGQSPTATEAMLAKLERAHEGTSTVGGPVQDGLFSGV